MLASLIFLLPLNKKAKLFKPSMDYNIKVGIYQLINVKFPFTIAPKKIKRRLYCHKFFFAFFFYKACFTYKLINFIVSSSK